VRFLSLAPLIYRGRCQSQEKGIMRTKKRSGDDIPTSITVGSLKPVIQALIAIASLLIPAPHYQHAPISRSCFSHPALFQRFMVLLCSSRVHMRSLASFLSITSSWSISMILDLTLRLFIENATADQ
jgi:hypothetical protein